MEKIPFDIKYRPEIEAGKYFVQTRLGSSARIICWDKKCYHPEDCYPIVALVNNKFENVNIYSKTGKYDYKERKSNLDLFLVPNPDYKEPAAKPSANPEKDKIVPTIQWTGSNLKEVIDFTGKSPRFGEWFKSWEEFENYVHTHNDILKLFCEDGSHYEVPVGAWIVKTPDGYNVPSIAKYIQQEQPSVDWDAFRREAAKDFVAAYFANPNCNNLATDSIIKNCITAANELVWNLKKKKK